MFHPSISLVFYHIHLVITNMSVQLCKVHLDKLSCFHYFVFHFICGTQLSLLVRLIWSHFHEPSLQFWMLCLSCIVLQALYVVVFATHHLWFIFTVELSCSWRTLWFLTCFLWLVLAAWIWVSCSCYLLLLRIFIHSVPFSSDLPFSAFYCLLRTGIVCWKSSLGGSVCDCLFFKLAAGSHGGSKTYYGNHH